MADVALQFVVETLVPIIIENWQLIGGAKEDSAHLLGELNRLKAFLKDAATYRQSNSEQWKYFIKEVQVMVYKAEGLIDKLLVKEKLHQEKNIIMQNLDAKYAKKVRDLAKQIRDALEQVKKSREQNPEAFQAKPMLDDQPEIVAPGPQFYKMENGGLFKQVCQKTDQPGTSRRLCIKFSLLEAFLCKRPSADHVRSFLCFSPKQKESEKLSNSQLLHKAFPLVRVLDVESLKFSFSRELHHLRYIAISGDYSALPTFFGKFWYLQTLILNNSTKAQTIEIKVDIWNMLQLRHLHTNVPAKLPSPATQTTDESSCLQTLSKVAPESCTEDVLARACNLRKVSVQGQMAEFFEAKKGGFNNFQKLKCLEQLKLVNDVGSSMSKVQLPQAFLGFLRRLQKLTLSNTRFVWSDANKLGQLECLQVLKLKENAFCGTAWDSVGIMD